MITINQNLLYLPICCNVFTGFCDEIVTVVAVVPFDEDSDENCPPGLDKNCPPGSFAAVVLGCTEECIPEWER